MRKSTFSYSSQFIKLLGYIEFKTKDYFMNHDYYETTGIKLLKMHLKFIVI